MSQAPIEHPSDLSAEQRQYLRNIWTFLDNPPTLGRIYQRTALANLLLILVGGCLVGAFLALESVAGAYVAGGAFLGLFLRDLGLNLRAIRLWPSTKAVINRQMLAHLLNEHSHDSDSADRT